MNITPEIIAAAKLHREQVEQAWFAKRAAQRQPLLDTLASIRHEVNQKLQERLLKIDPRHQWMEDDYNLTIQSLRIVAYRYEKAKPTPAVPATEVVPVMA